MKKYQVCESCFENLSHSHSRKLIAYKYNDCQQKPTCYQNPRKVPFPDRNLVEWLIKQLWKDHPDILITVKENMAKWAWDRDEDPSDFLVSQRALKVCSHNLESAFMSTQGMLRAISQVKCEDDVACPKLKE